MEKRNKRIKLIALLLVLVVATCCFTGYTLAKYTSSVTMTSSTVTVAKWSIEVNDTQIAVTGTAPTVTFDLFKTIKEADGTTAESDVASGKIAPGTGGKCDLKVENLSDVKAKYSLTFDLSGCSAPLEFSTDGTNWGTTLTGATDKEIAMTNGTDTLTIYWRWAFERTDGDAADTALGIAGTATAIVSATITVTQVD